MDEFETASRRAMYLLGVKDHSKSELLEKLKKNYSTATARKVADRMEELGYIDDAKYAQRLAEKLICSKSLGKSRAALEMKQKGLSGELINEALDEYSREDIVGVIAATIRKKYMEKLFGDYDDIETLKKEQSRVIAALARRGYSWTEIKSAIELVSAQADEDMDML